MSDLLVHLLIALVAVTIVGRLLGWLCGYVGQPPVIGEIVGGILLGPSLLGALWPAAYQFLLPSHIVPALGTVADVAVILYMFLVGLELSTDALAGPVKATIVIAEAGIVVPLVLGVALSAGLYAPFSPAAVSFAHFALFVGVAMSITAFPVLARILSDLGMSRTPLGMRALTSAATADITAWCLLALVIGLVQATPGAAAVTALLSVVFVVTVVAVGRPTLSRFVRRAEARGQTLAVVAAAIGALVASAWITQAIGIHAVIGAFLAGAAIPHDSGIARALTRRMGPPVIVFLLPAFFAFVGVKTEIGLISGVSGWLWCGVIVLVATIGKFGGTYVAARAVGLDTRQAAGLGILMNTRGLMELVVLNIGLELGVITPTLFTMMTIMALVTTSMAAPVLRRFSYPRQ